MVLKFVKCRANYGQKMSFYVCSSGGANYFDNAKRIFEMHQNFIQYIDAQTVGI